MEADCNVQTVIVSKSIRTGLIVIALLLAACCAELWGAGVKVGIIGDQTFSSDLKGSYAVMEQGIAALMKHSPDVIVHTGDIVESTLDPADVSTNFDHVAGLLKKTGAPWYLTAGDHDVNPPLYKPGSSDRSREELFLSLYRRHNPDIKNLYYSFDKGGFHFIVLYSGENLHTDPRWGNVFLAGIGERQMEWLGKDLEKHRVSRGIVIFVHQPLWYNWARWAPIHRLLRRYPVAAVVAGHFHYNQDEGLLDGIRYVVVGATGGQIKNADKEAGGIHHVTIMTVHEDRRVEFRLLPLSSPGDLVFASRFDMDRVQALEYVLGNMENFTDINKIYVKRRSRLVNDCSSEEPARIRISSLGNPLDVPVDFTVELSDTSVVRLISSRFQAGACFTDDGMKCSLKPSYGVVTANPSGVTVGSTAGPLWVGELRATEEGTTLPGSIGFTIILSFPSFDKSKRLRLYYRTNRINVVCCTQ